MTKVGLMPPPILITGCGRSGASMIAGIMNICGAFGGFMGRVDGHYENVKINRRLLVPYLQVNDADPKGQYPLPDIGRLTIPTDWADRVAAIMCEDGYCGQGPWMVKGSRLCLIWPVWAKAYPTAKWLIVRRRTGDIISSCHKTGFMRAFHKKEVLCAVGAKNTVEGWKWWVHQHEQRFIEMTMSGRERGQELFLKIVWPERMVFGDYQQIQETVEWVGLPWQEDKVLSYMDPKLWWARHNLIV
jgi:hypothetical protein